MKPIEAWQVFDSSGGLIGGIAMSRDEACAAFVRCDNYAEAANEWDAWVAQGYTCRPLLLIDPEEYATLQREAEALRVFRKHVEDNEGCMCEWETGERIKDCEICYPR